MKNVNSNPYLPRSAVIREVIAENSQIKSFVLAFVDVAYNCAFSYLPGQFMMVSVPNCGEAPISICSSPTRPGTIQLSIRSAGKLTAAIHAMRPGAVIGLRGPYGRPFPVEQLKKKELLFVAGGVGLAPLRSFIDYCLDRGPAYGRKTILYGSRNPDDIAFKADIKAWQRRPDVRCLLTVDEAGPGWDGPVGVVTTLLDRIEMQPSASAALVCGPPMMIRFVLAELQRLGFADENIITTMERHMQCGIGICQHCHLDGKLICVDGPVFTRAELKGLRVTELAP